MTERDWSVRRIPHHEVRWVDGGSEPKCPPDPRWPNGVNVDASMDGAKSCEVELPYPAPRCGHFAVTCDVCGLRMRITAAGRADDPHWLKLPCWHLAPTTVEGGRA